MRGGVGHGRDGMTGIGCGASCSHAHAECIRLKNSGTRVRRSSRTKGSIPKQLQDYTTPSNLSLRLAFPHATSSPFRRYQSAARQHHHHHQLLPYSQQPLCHEAGKLRKMVKH